MHIVLMCVVGLLIGSAGAAAADALVVVTSRDDGPYEGVVAGVRGALGAWTELTVHSLQSGREGAVEALRDAKTDRKTPLITVGSAATRAALEAPGKAPVIACMIADRDDLQKSKNATGVVLEFPLETQLKWVRRFVPGSKTIGVLYNPEQNQARVESATKIASRLGLRMVAREVHRPQDLPGALDSLAREVDLLFALTDHTVLSPQTAQAILLFSFRNRIPFSGLSASWVKAGALYALERDYEDIGAQCAEMAAKVLKGARPGSIRPAIPRKVTFAVNLKTADHLKLRLAQELVDDAAEVFR